MILSEFTEHIGNLIGKDDLQSAIRDMGQFLRNSPKLDEVILQSSRYTELMGQIRNGTISFEDASVGKNQIRFALLSLLREIEDNETANPEVRAEIEALDMPVAKTSIRQSHSGSGDNVGGDKIINNKL